MVPQQEIPNDEMYFTLGMLFHNTTARKRSMARSPRIRQILPLLVVPFLVVTTCFEPAEGFHSGGSSRWIIPCRTSLLHQLSRPAREAPAICGRFHRHRGNSHPRLGILQYESGPDGWPRSRSLSASRREGARYLLLRWRPLFRPVTVIPGAHARRDSEDVLRKTGDPVHLPPTLPLQQVPREGLTPGNGEIPHPGW